MSAILIFEAPASAQISTTASSTCGFVVAASSGRADQDTLGFITTTSPLDTKRLMPPAASNTFFVKSFTE